MVDSVAYKKIVEVFGEKVVVPGDRSIDRKVLGSIVFKDKQEMKKLTDIVWFGRGGSFCAYPS